jgi:uncharacterized protein (DUF1800 family)
VDLDYKAFSPSQAWTPLPEAAWTTENATHFLRRTGFTATPVATEIVLSEGLVASINRRFGDPQQMPLPYKAKIFEEKTRGERIRLRDAPKSERQQFFRENRVEQNDAVLDYGIHWMQYARDERHSAFEKWVLFLQDVFVVGLPKVRNPYLLYAHQALLRESAMGDFATLCKRVSRSPGMILYLDLQRNEKGKPNENFARELFELFLLGEGNYTENDVKEAARAFTGYKTDGSAFRFVSRQHDFGRKTVFGETGMFQGDDIIDSALTQPAARTFLPSELLRVYLSADIKLDRPYLERLGEIWRGSGFDLEELMRTVFSSRLFYHPQFRGNMIKSPIQYYLGLLQDMELDVPPFPRGTLSALRNMGQPFYAPPNVRGWVGGRAWINASTLAARHQVVDAILQPIEEENLNADDYAELMVARLNGHANLTVSEEHWDRLAETTRIGAGFAELAERFSPNPVSAEFVNRITNHYKNGSCSPRHRLKEIVSTLLQSPQYQLC